MKIKISLKNMALIDPRRGLSDDILLEVFKKVGLRDILASGKLLSKEYRDFIQERLGVGYSNLSIPWPNQYFALIYNYDNKNAYGLRFSDEYFEPEDGPSVFLGWTLTFDNLTEGIQSEFSFLTDKQSVQFLGDFIANDIFVFVDQEAFEMQFYNIKTGKKVAVMSSRVLDVGLYAYYIRWNEEKQLVSIAFRVGTGVWSLAGKKTTGFFLAHISLSGEYEVNLEGFDFPIPKESVPAFIPYILLLAAHGNELILKMDIAGLFIFNIQSKDFQKLNLDGESTIGAELYESYNLIFTLDPVKGKMNYHFFYKDWVPLIKHQFDIREVPIKYEEKEVFDHDWDHHGKFILSGKKGAFFILSNRGVLIKQTLIDRRTKELVASREVEKFKNLSD